MKTLKTIPLALLALAIGCGGGSPHQTPPPPQCDTSGFNNKTTDPSSNLLQLWTSAQHNVTQGVKTTCNGQPCTVSDSRANTIQPGCITVQTSANPGAQVDTTTNPITVTVPQNLDPGAIVYDFETVILFRLGYDISGRTPPSN